MSRIVEINKQEVDEKTAHIQGSFLLFSIRCFPLWVLMRILTRRKLQRSKYRKNNQALKLKTSWILIQKSSSPFLIEGRKKWVQILCQWRNAIEYYQNFPAWLEFWVANVFDSFEWVICLDVEVFVFKGINYVGI